MSAESKKETDSSPAPEPQTSEVHAKPHQLLTPSKRAVLLIVLMCIVGAGLVAYSLTRPAKRPVTTNSVKTNQVCSDQLITDASTAINKNDEAALSAYKKQILGLKGYDKDINCVFILERYALMQTNLQDIKKYAAILKPLYGPQNYSNKFTTQVYTPQQIDGVIASLQENNDFQAQQDSSEEAEMMAMDRLQDQAAGQKQ